MPALHIQSLSQDLYSYLQQLAVAQNRTVDTQVIAVLSQFKQQQEKREQQARILADIYHSRLECPSHAPDSTTLLREDRAR
jgi:hypothetical protein